MTIHTPDNSRERGSRITNTAILEPGDMLELWGTAFLARIAILDSHDPTVLIPRELQTSSTLPNHHHTLMQLEDEEGVLSSGLYVRRGSASDLYFSHLTPAQQVNEAYREKLRRINTLVSRGLEGLFYLSDQEQLTATPQGRQYLDDEGKLRLY